jgi:hypothetical protein
MTLQEEARAPALSAARIIAARAAGEDAEPAAAQAGSKAGSRAEVFMESQFQVKIVLIFTWKRIAAYDAGLRGEHSLRSWSLTVTPILSLDAILVKQPAVLRKGGGCRGGTAGRKIGSRPECAAKTYGS